MTIKHTSDKKGVSAIAVVAVLAVVVIVAAGAYVVFTKYNEDDNGDNSDVGLGIGSKFYYNIESIEGDDVPDDQVAMYITCEVVGESEDYYYITIASQVSGATDLPMNTVKMNKTDGSIGWAEQVDDEWTLTTTTVLFEEAQYSLKVDSYDFGPMISFIEIKTEYDEPTTAAIDTSKNDIKAPSEYKSTDMIGKEFLYDYSETLTFEQPATKTVNVDGEFNVKIAGITANDGEYIIEMVGDEEYTSEGEIPYTIHLNMPYVSKYTYPITDGEKSEESTYNFDDVENQVLIQTSETYQGEPMEIKSFVDFDSPLVYEVDVSADMELGGAVFSDAVAIKLVESDI